MTHHPPHRGSQFRLVTACVLASILAFAGRALNPAMAFAQQASDYVIGAQDVLAITSYDQADLSGRFSVEADGTFTFPLIGRVKAGGLTLRAMEAELKRRLKDEGYFRNPQITVSIDQYKSQKIFIVGEVRAPGAYQLSGDMSLIEALARAGSMLPSASGEALIVHLAPGQNLADALSTPQNASNIARVNLKDLENGILSQNAVLRDGDTIVVPRAQSVYVFGQVKNPGAYPLQQTDTTVLQALSLAGGVTESAATNRIKIIRMENGKKQEVRVKLGDLVKPGDTIIIAERYF
jgi:polysaccharide export outer membrane protein